MWSRHLLAFLSVSTGSTTLIGARAVTYVPCFPHYVSPDKEDMALGAVAVWPAGSCLILWSGFAPQQRSQVLEEARLHPSPVWILFCREASRPSGDDRKLIHQAGAVLVSTIPANGLVTHTASAWTSGAFAARPAPGVTEIRVWCMHCSPLLRSADHVAVPRLSRPLGNWAIRREDFFDVPTEDRVTLQVYRQHQQDAIQYRWAGWTAATDGSVSRASKRVGAGMVLYSPIGHRHCRMSIRVGGRLSSLRAEAAASPPSVQRRPRCTYCCCTPLSGSIF